MSSNARAWALLSSLGLFTAACGGGGTTSTGTGGHVGTGGTGGAGGAPCTGVCPTSKVQHLVVIVQENHTFDNHFGRYCTAPSGSAPTCNDGPACCEAGPDAEPSGVAPTTLDDAANGGYSPDHTQACELDEIHGGAMDRFVTSACGNAANFAYAKPSIVQPYWDLAKQYALADRYFQPIAGASSSNDMYLARAGYVFTDNAYEPQGSATVECTGVAVKSFTEPTIGDLLNQASVPWAFYAEGYADAVALAGSCPTTAPADCAAGVPFYPCVFDPGDVPFEYYSSLVGNPTTMRDLGDFDAAVAAGTLPAVSYVKLIGYKSEHPAAGIKLSAGVKAVTGLVQQILAGPQKDDVLVLVVYDEGGGYFDHVAPPPASAADGKAYGTRLPFLALGPFARTNWVSHVTMEHSSIVRFIEWNWLSGTTGQLGGRDMTVNGLGSLLDPARTGVPVTD
jgi:phospholipase C